MKALFSWLKQPKVEPPIVDPNFIPEKLVKPVKKLSRALREPPKKIKVHITQYAQKTIYAVLVAREGFLPTVETWADNPSLLSKKQMKTLGVLGWKKVVLDVTEKDRA